MAITLTSGGKQPVNHLGANISYPKKFPRGNSLYFVMHPDDVPRAAAALHNHISQKVPGYEKGIPLHVFEIDVEGKRLGLIASADKDFHLGIDETQAVGRENIPGAARLQLDMRSVTTRWGRIKTQVYNDIAEIFHLDTAYAPDVEGRLMGRACDVEEARAVAAAGHASAENAGADYGHEVRVDHAQRIDQQRQQRGPIEKD